MPATLPLLDATEALCCAPLGSAEFSLDGDAEEVAARLRAMADANRVRILQALSCCDGHAMTTSDVAELLDVSPATANHHLKQLELAGMVERHRVGARVLYRLRLDSVRAVSRTLAVTCGAHDACC